MTKTCQPFEELQQLTYSGERREPRYPINKRLRITVGWVGLEALMVNASLHGFCIRVSNGALKRGQAITLAYPWGEVIARVVWTRDAGDETEAGLFVP